MLRVQTVYTKHAHTWPTKGPNCRWEATSCCHVPLSRPGLAWLIWFNLTKCSRHAAAPRQQPSIILGTVQICQPGAGGGGWCGTWTVDCGYWRCQHSGTLYWKLGAFGGFYQRSLKLPVNRSLWTSVPTGGEALFKCPFIILIASWCSVCFQE